MEIAALTQEQQNFSRKLVIAAIALVVMYYLGWRLSESSYSPAAVAHAVIEHATAGHIDHGAEAVHHTIVPPAFYSILPFAALLLCIALLPLFHKTEEWWEYNWNRFAVAVGLGAVTLGYFALIYGHGVVDHTTHEMSAIGWPAAVTVLKIAIFVEYIPFIALLFCLYVISGGIAIEGRLVGTPKLNTTIIAIGGALASFIGTTGAAMLLIRPLLNANAKRDHVSHTVIFFIFVVCNTGGCLLPIGDPPLFLGFLRGVGFLWTLQLWPMFLFVNFSLIAVYFVWDKLKYRKEDQAVIEAPDENPKPFAIRGYLNFVWLVGVIFCVALLDPSKAIPGTHWHAPAYFREIVMLGLTALSLYFTKPAIRQQNAFNYDAILEVAALFIGIFICMQAPVQILNVYGSQLGFDSPQKFFWGTGILSSFLDNAPTYVVFFETAKTMPADSLTEAGVMVKFLVPIALGSVFSDRPRVGLYGSHDLHRQRTEFHGESDCREE